jgi:hypothetical protein
MAPIILLGDLWPSEVYPFAEFLSLVYKFCLALRLAVETFDS